MQLQLQLHIHVCIVFKYIVYLCSRLLTTFQIYFNINPGKLNVRVLEAYKVV